MDTVAGNYITVREPLEIAVGGNGGGELHHGWRGRGGGRERGRGRGRKGAREEGGHMVGGSFTLADLFAFSVVNTYRAGFLDGVPLEGWLEKLPKLKAVVDKVAAVPKIREYYTEKAASNKMYAYFVPR